MGDNQLAENEQYQDLLTKLPKESARYKTICFYYSNGKSLEELRRDMRWIANVSHERITGKKRKRYVYKPPEDRDDIDEYIASRGLY